MYFFSTYFMCIIVHRTCTCFFFPLIYCLHVICNFSHIVVLLWFYSFQATRLLKNCNLMKILMFVWWHFYFPVNICFLVKYEWNTSWLYFDFFLTCTYPLFSMDGINLHITLQTTEHESKYELHNHRHSSIHSERSVLNRAMDSVVYLTLDTISHLLIYYFSKLIVLNNLCFFFPEK